MTNHPLTDEMCENIYDLTCEADAMMRFAYDLGEDKGRADMLEQVIEWLQANLWLCDDNLGPLYIKEDCLSDKVIDEEMVIDDLKKAMRPQQQENS